ncbi:hypothetical protein DIPPA_18594 [Diplonema papillatum]|nr:hypothetical protein DIPPA_18594 [Diplonema papillatum]
MSHPRTWADDVAIYAAADLYDRDMYLFTIGTDGDRALLPIRNTLPHGGPVGRVPRRRAAPGPAGDGPCAEVHHRRYQRQAGPTKPRCLLMMDSMDSPLGGGGGAGRLAAEEDVAAGGGSEEEEGKDDEAGFDAAAGCSANIAFFCPGWQEAVRFAAAGCFAAGFFAAGGGRAEEEEEEEEEEEAAGFDDAAAAAAGPSAGFASFCPAGWWWPPARFAESFAAGFFAGGGPAGWSEAARFAAGFFLAGAEDSFGAAFFCGTSGVPYRPGHRARCHAMRSGGGVFFATQSNAPSTLSGTAASPAT